MRRNGTIDVFRYICAVMVVAIHTLPFYDINEYIGYIATEVLTRIAVPFFFLTSGYFYIRALKKDKSVFIGYLLRILKTYAVWSCVYYLVDFLQWGHTNLKGFAVNCIYTFTVTGSHYHFWYFPALIVSICLVTFAYRIGCQKFLFSVSIILYIIGCLGCSYSTVGQMIPGLAYLYHLDTFLLIRRMFLMGFPFFVAGIVADWIKSYCEENEIGLKTQAVVMAGVIGAWLIEIVVIAFLNLGNNIIITFGLYLLTVCVFTFPLMHPGSYGKIAAQCRVSADWTYYVHPLVIIGIQGFGRSFGITIDNTLLFFLAILFVSVTQCILTTLKDWILVGKSDG